MQSTKSPNRATTDDDSRERLIESEALYESFAETLPMSVVRKDLEGRITYANATLRQHHSFGQNELIGKTDYDLSPKDLADKYRRDDRLVAETGKLFECVERFRESDGQMRFMHVFKTPIFDRMGGIIGVQAIFWDVTDKHRAEESLRDSEVRKQAIFEASLDCIIFIDEKDKIVEFNRAAEKAFACDRNKAINQPMSLFIASDSRERYKENLLRYTSQGEVGSMLSALLELRCTRQNGKCFDAEIAIQPIPLASETGFALFVRDITERKQARRSLERSARELKRSNQELADFASIVSHDLQAPARRVECLANMLIEQSNAKLDAEGQELLAMLGDTANRMQELIRDLLAYARLDSQPRPPELTDLRSVVDEIIGRFELPPGGRITRGKLPTLSTDPTLIRQVFQNLIGNALKYRSQNPPEVRIDANLDGHYWRFCVSDNGIGFDPKHAPSIFKIFKRLHGDGQFPGTGVGLAICKKAIERLGGKIWPESEPGKGSKFYFTLPDAH